MNEPALNAPAQNHSDLQRNSPRGRIWTLVVAVAVFCWILLTISTYVLNRLSGEQVSPNAPLQVFRVLTEQQNSTHPTTSTPDSVQREIVPALQASDFQTFRGWQHADYKSQLRINLKPNSGSRLQSLIDRHPQLQLAVVVRGKLVGISSTQNICRQYLQLTLEFCTAADANEVFARLTQ